LITLRDLLAEQLKQKGRWSWAQEEFGLLTEVPFQTDTDDTPSFLRIKGAKLLKPKELAILKVLHAWRDGVAARLDRAPFMVLGNDVLLGLAKEPTTDKAELARRKGVGESTMKKNAAAILQAVKQGLDTPKEDWPRIPRPKRHPRDPDLEDRLKRLKVKRDELMERLELRPGVVCPNQVLMEIARTLPGDRDSLKALPGVRNWQAETFGEELLSVL
jgi:ribonuclease D